jgi:hypothetical protein
MRLLGRFAIGLLLIGLGLGWWARRRWGPLRSLAPWVAALALAPLHAVIVGVRGVSIGADAAALLTYAVATVVLLAAAVGAIAWTRRVHPRWSAPVPLAQALLQALATSALGPAYAAAGAAPPGLGSAIVVALTIVVFGAGLVWATPPSEGRRPFGWLRRSGRLRS